MRTTLHVVVWLRCNSCSVYASSPLRDRLNIIWHMGNSRHGNTNSQCICSAWSWVAVDLIATQFLTIICCLSLFCGSSSRWFVNFASALHRQLPAGWFLFQQKCLPISPSWDCRAVKFLSGVSMCRGFERKWTHREIEKFVRGLTKGLQK